MSVQGVPDLLREWKGSYWSPFEPRRGLFLRRQPHKALTLEHLSCWLLLRQHQGQEAGPFPFKDSQSLVVTSQRSLIDTWWHSSTQVPLMIIYVKGSSPPWLVPSLGRRFWAVMKGSWESWCSKPVSNILLWFLLQSCFQVPQWGTI